jgi:hypothetical protein
VARRPISTLLGTAMYCPTLFSNARLISSLQFAREWTPSLPRPRLQEM